jgi:hypothetical protein
LPGSGGIRRHGQLIRYPHRTLSPKGPSLSLAETGPSRTVKVVAVVVAVALVAVAIAAFVLTRNSSHPNKLPAAVGSSPSARPTPTLLPQAKWRVRAFPAGVVGTVTKKDLKAVRLQGVRASHAVENVYNALLLDPSDVTRVTRAHFEQGAARAFLHARGRIPGEMQRVRTTRRSLQIGLDAKSASKAVATVSVSFKARRNSRKVRVKLKSTLWLERKHRSWQVVAWRAAQGPRR